ncbi:MAG: hypothetical protein RIT24_2731 [Planctomycetota bacterium]
MSLGWKNEQALRCRACSFFQARRTGIEPATTGVTSRYSNQLSYRPNTSAANREGRKE